MPEGINIGPFFVRYYGIVIMFGAFLAAILAYLSAKRKGQDPETVWDLMTWLLIGGIAGARLWHVFTPSPTSIAEGRDTVFYLTHPFDLINIPGGGLGIPGAVMGGALALYLFTRRRGLSFPVWADIAVPSVALGQAIGRWGNFFNQELYGAPTDLPWKIYIDPAHRLPGFSAFEHYHPLFLYESIWNFLNMGLLLWIDMKFRDKLQLKDGDICLMYLITYPIGRFLLDFLRLDASQLGGINANQTLMAVVILFAASLLFLRHRQETETA